MVGFLYMSTLISVRLRSTVRSRKSMELCSSYVGLSFILLCIYICILCKYALMVCKLMFIVSKRLKYHVKFLLIIKAATYIIVIFDT
jgi:hypothetical protein